MLPTRRDGKTANKATNDNVRSPTDEKSTKLSMQSYLAPLKKKRREFSTLTTYSGRHGESEFLHENEKVNTVGSFLSKEFSRLVLVLRD